MKSVLAVFSAVLAALICAATGAYILWQFHTTFGLVGGVGLVLLSVAIALPTQLKRGSAELKDSVVVVVEQAEHALKGDSSKDGG